jgi:hypothetical protein
MFFTFGDELRGNVQCGAQHGEIGLVVANGLTKLF